jgi:ABC-type uncharacterized transport system permease subunit
MQRAVQVPSDFITALNGLVVVFVVGSEIWSRRQARRRELQPSCDAAGAYSEVEAGT